MSKKTQWLEGELDWFDQMSGTGFIRGSDNELYFVHKTAFDDMPRKKIKNKKVKFTVYEDASSKQVEKVATL